MTILIYGFAGLVIATVLSVILRRIAVRRFANHGQGSPYLATVATVAPFLGLFWLIVAFLINVQISNRFAHQDCGFSADPYVTLPNGYTLGSLNTYDGYIKAPGVSTGMPVTGPGYVRSVVTVAYVGGVFRGTLYDFDAKGLRTFVFDTKDRSIKLDDPPNPYTWDAAQALAHTEPESYWNLYSRYRHRWPNFIFIALTLLGEGVICLWLVNLAQRTPKSD